jgi:hypothetical protein
MLSFQSLSYGGSTYTANVDGRGYYAGPFDVSLNGGSSFQTFCADLNDETVFNSPTSVLLRDTLTMGSNYQLAAQLYNQYDPTVGSDLTKNAGLQVAIWQALNPSISVSDFWQSGVTAAAQADFAGLLSTTSKEATFYDFGGHNQGQIGKATQAVPEPTSIAALGLGVLGFIRKRRLK